MQLWPFVPAISAHLGGEVSNFEAGPGGLGTYPDGPRDMFYYYPEAVP